MNHYSPVSASLKDYFYSLFLKIALPTTSSKLVFGRLFQPSSSLFPRTLQNQEEHS